MTRREVAVAVAWHYLGKPYVWRGDDPTGFDCSGLVIECLKSAGALPRSGDWTAHDLWRRFETLGQDETVLPGDCAFWFDGDRAIHVGLCLGDGLYLGAEGGGSWAVDPEAALLRNAYIQVRPLSSRPGARFARPLYLED